jgi:hypothetical protein
VRALAPLRPTRGADPYRLPVNYTSCTPLNHFLGQVNEPTLLVGWASRSVAFLNGADDVIGGVVAFICPDITGFEDHYLLSWVVVHNLSNYTSCPLDRKWLVPGPVVGQADDVEIVNSILTEAIQ